MSNQEVTTFTNALGLDIGTVRTGVARVNAIARIPEPIAVLSMDESFDDRLRSLVSEYDVDLLVVGMPRNMSGEQTAQSTHVAEQVAHIKTLISIPVIEQDETLSTVEAARSVPQKHPELLDAYAACIILSDFLIGVAIPNQNIAFDQRLAG